MTARRLAGTGAIGLVLSVGAGASELRLQLKGTEPMKRQIVQFTCDSKAGALGLPSGTFPVEYVNGAGNSLAVLPVGGKSLIFAGVMSGSGARYAADRYTWSDGGVTRGAFLTTDFNDPNAITQCKQVK